MIVQWKVHTKMSIASVHAHFYAKKYYVYINVWLHGVSQPS